MKYIIKHVVSGKYWNGSGEWVSDIFHARQYSSLDGLNVLNDKNVIPMIAKIIETPIPKEEPIVYVDFDISEADLMVKDLHNFCRYAKAEEIIIYGICKTMLYEYKKAKDEGLPILGDPLQAIEFIKQINKKYNEEYCGTV